MRPVAAKAKSATASHMARVTLAQPDLFPKSDLLTPALPAGFVYRPEVLTAAEETALLTAFEALDFRPFAFRGYFGKRRVTSFGWRYDFERRAVQPTAPIPDFLLPVRDKAAAFAGLAADDLQQALVTEYAPGAPIGWHRDRPEFGQVVGLSLASPCLFRLRRAKEKGWERRSLTVAPRSAYLISGEARTDWEHSIPEVDALRYSITFRTLRAP